MKTIAAALAVLMFGLAAHAQHPPAHGQKFLSVVVRNETNAVVHYKVRWAHGTWVSYHIAPRGQRIHAISAAGGYKRLEFSFDGDFRTGHIRQTSSTQFPREVYDRIYGTPIRFRANGHNLVLGW